MKTPQNLHNWTENVSKKEIIFIAKDNEECSYCGICSFDHKHPPNTLPKDFIIIEPVEPKGSMKTLNISQIKTKEIKDIINNLTPIYYEIS